MSEKIEGLSLSLDLDYSRIDEGMKGLKRELSVVNSEFNANLSAFQRRRIYWKISSNHRRA